MCSCTTYFCYRGTPQFDMEERPPPAKHSRGIRYRLDDENNEDGYRPHELTKAELKRKQRHEEKMRLHEEKKRQKHEERMQIKMHDLSKNFGFRYLRLILGVRYTNSGDFFCLYVYHIS